MRRMIYEKLFAVKKQEAWIKPTLLNSFTLHPTSPIMYMKDEFGFVHIKGRVVAPNTTTAVAFKLPAGYRPDINCEYLYSNFGNPVRLTIDTDGNVLLNSPGIAWNSLDGITLKGEK